MTVLELRKILENYPSDMNAQVAIVHQIADLNCVTSGVDMDTNQKSVWLCHEKPSNEKWITTTSYDIGTSSASRFMEVANAELH